MTRLKLLRMQRGFNQRQAASFLGIPAPLLSRIENGWYTRCPNAEILMPALQQMCGEGETFETLMQQSEGGDPF